MENKQWTMTTNSVPIWTEDRIYEKKVSFSSDEKKLMSIWHFWKKSGEFTKVLDKPFIMSINLNSALDPN